MDSRSNADILRGRIDGAYLKSRGIERASVEEIEEASSSTDDPEFTKTVLKRWKEGEITTEDAHQELFDKFGKNRGSVFLLKKRMREL